MTDNISGGSATTINDGFGFGGTASDSKTSVPQKAEDSAPKGGGQISVTEETSKEVETEAKAVQEEEKNLNNSADQSHRAVIDMLEDKLQQVKTGVLEEMELKQWFQAHPELADTANRSKRIKEQYREFMESPAKETSPKKAETSAKETIDKPITLRELQKYNEEQEVRILEKALTAQRTDKFQNFAEKHKVMDDDVDALKRNTEALFKANPDWTYDQAMQGAYNAQNPRKGKPNNISNGSMAAPEAASTKFDASTGAQQIMSSADFTGGQIK